MSPDAAPFARAVAALDAGDETELRALLEAHPDLVRRRWVGHSDDAYFADPYLLWFVANNPIREERMPANVVALTTAIIEAAEHNGVESRQDQLDYAVALVASGRVPREAGVQLDLIDVLVDAGASPDALVAALAHRETAAATRLVERGAALTLLAAVCLDRSDDATRLLADASAEELFLALAGAAIYGNAPALLTLIAAGADPNGLCPEGFHPHSTPVHQAVFSGSLDAVRVLVDAGADLSVRDSTFDSTPFGWADYGGLDDIAAFLRDARAP